MTLPAPGPQDAGWGGRAGPQRVSGAPERTEHAGRRSRGLPGGRVVAFASLVVIVMALAEVALRDRIGLWTGVTLIVVASVSPLVTRAGDRSLPAMMPPLAFLVAVLIAGQSLLPEGSGSWRSQQALMLVQTLGPNAVWVVVATVLSTGLAAIRHLADR